MNNKIILILVVLLSGCIHRQNSYKAVSVSGFMNSDFNLELRSGKITPYDTIGSQIYYRIDFDKVKGGDSLLFGLWTMSETDGHKVGRLEVYNRNNELVTRLSINEITDTLLNFENINLEKFIQ